MALYNLSNEYDIESLKLRLKNDIEKGKIVEYKDKRNRSLNQNSYLHLIIGLFAHETGETRHYVKEIIFKLTCNSDIFLYNTFNKYLNTRHTLLKSTSEISKEEMQKAIDRFRNFSAGEAGMLVSVAIGCCGMLQN